MKGQGGGWVALQTRGDAVRWDYWRPLDGSRRVHACMHRASCMRWYAHAHAPGRAFMYQHAACMRPGVQDVASKFFWFALVLVLMDNAGAAIGVLVSCMFNDIGGACCVQRLAGEQPAAVDAAG